MFKKNTAVTGFTFGLVSVSDGSDITTGTPVGYYTLDGGAQTTIDDVTPVHEGNGQWSFDLLAAEMNGDVIGLVFTHASAITVHFTIKTDTKIVSELNDFDAANDDVALVTLATDLTNLPSIPANWLTAVGIAAGAIDAAALDSTAVDEIADGVVDELLAPHVTVDSLAVHMKDILDDVTGLAGAAMRGTDGANTVVPDAAGVAATPAEVATALTDIHLDHLFQTDYDPTSKPGVATALMNELVESDGGVSRFTANAIEQIWSVTLSEITSIPAATPTAAQAMMLGFQAIRNKRDTTASSDEIHTSGGAVVATAVLSDDTVVFTKEKYA